MDKELRYFLEQGKHTVADLARLTGTARSTLYNRLKHPDVKQEDGKYWVEAAASPLEATGAIAAPESTPPSVEAPVVAPVGSKGRGRPATAAGQTLYPAGSGLVHNAPPGTMDNPRRPNSHGYRSLQIIIDNPGIKTEEFVAKGGRLNDLRWDLAAGNVRTE